MIQLWQGLKITFPDAAPALDEGLEKLATYQECLDVVPAYPLATSEQIWQILHYLY